MITRNENPFIDDVKTSSSFSVNREYKSSLFAYLFTHDKNNALSLYNSINGSHHTNVEDLTYELLDNAIFVKVKNDVSFIFDKSINLYEHQSTYNPNMPLRGFMYFADLYNIIINKPDLFRDSLVKIPIPKYVVFYNGVDKKNLPDISYQHLSDAFDCDTKPKGFEWTATMININSNHSKELLEKCKILSDYSTFVDLIRKYKYEHDLKNAILIAIDECVKNNVLKEILTKFSREVATMAWFEFDEEAYEKAIIDEREKAIAEAVAKVVAVKDAEIADKDAEIADKDAKIADKNAEIERLKNMLAAK